MWLIIDYVDGDIKATQVTMLLVRGDCLEYQEVSSEADNVTFLEYRQAEDVYVMGLTDHESILAKKMTEFAKQRISEYKEQIKGESKCNQSCLVSMGCGI